MTDRTPPDQNDLSNTISWQRDDANELTRGLSTTEQECNRLLDEFAAICRGQRLNWTTHVRFLRRLGAGGQGVVFLCERPGADGFTLPVALKFFSPERYRALVDYDAAMQRISRVAAQVARIQHENLLVVQNMIDRNRIRIMVMEFVEGFDLRALVGSDTLLTTSRSLPIEQQRYLERVLFTQGPTQPRFKAGVAMAIIRDCLTALAALHRDQIVHGDVKPANIMLRRSGHAKIIDIGSAFHLDTPPQSLNCTPEYAALEVLMGEAPSALSDLASLGFVLIELLSGQRLVSPTAGFADLVSIKRELPHRLQSVLPEEVRRNDLLMGFIHSMISPDPARRFPDAEAANLYEHGAAAFHRQLIKSDLSSEYDNDIRVLISELLDRQRVSV
ncbi:MAG: serine/threonine protein kinase [Planctomycetaceae bacterium]|nr:serine/threonine protein kinase [Planctomycetaceae bacterium]